MNNNQAKRDLALQFVRYKSAQCAGLYVNRTHCAQLDKSEELQHLLKKGLVVRKRAVQIGQMTTNTVLRPADGKTQSTMPVCKLCRNSIPYMLGSRGHEEGCAGIIEYINPKGPTWGQLVEARKRARRQRVKAIELKKAAMAKA